MGRHHVALADFTRRRDRICQLQAGVAAEFHDELGWSDRDAASTFRMAVIDHPLDADFGSPKLRAAIGTGAWCGPAMTGAVVADMASLIVVAIDRTGVASYGDLIRAGYKTEAIARFAAHATHIAAARCATLPEVA